MEPALTTEIVVQALDTLYSNGPADQSFGKDKADLLLSKMQTSVHAWQIADQLLRLNKDENTSYFGAQTMKTKIQNSFSELPVESYESLRDSLLTHCNNVTLETKPTIVTQLACALSDLALLMAAWKNSIVDIMQKFAPSTQHWSLLLEILILFPEEIEEKKLSLGENRRNEVCEELRLACPMFVQFLSAVLDSSSNDIHLQSKVFECLGSWLSMYVVPEQCLISSKLLNLPFITVQSKDSPGALHKAAADCICEALVSVEDLEKNMQLAKMLFEGILTLAEPYHMAVALQETEKCLSYCRIFTEMAESFLEPMAKTPNQGFGDFRTLELLLTCIGHHNFKMADITFNFWNRLSEYLYEEENKDAIAMFKPYVQRLIIALCRLCQYSSTHDGAADEREGFEKFRVYSTDLVKDVEFILGADTIFTHMYETLKGNGPNVSWEVCEAPLYIMKAIAKYIDSRADGVVPDVLQAIVTQPPHSHPLMQITSLKLVGELHRWLRHHPTYLEPVLPFVLRGVQNQKLSVTSSDALQKICEECSEHMIQHFTGLLQIVHSSEALQLNQPAVINVLHASSSILASLPHEQIGEGMKQLCIPHVDPLNKIVEMGNIPYTRDDKTSDPSVYLDRIATVFRYSTPKLAEGESHPCQEVFVQVWPLLLKVFQKYASESRVIERCCRCVRYAVRNLEQHSSFLLHPLVALLVDLYQRYPHSCCLYLGSIMVDMFGTDPTCSPLLFDMLQALVVPTMSVLERPDGLQNSPDVIDDLFRLGSRCLYKMPIPYLQSSISKSVFACGVNACAVSHSEANASVVRYLYEFINLAKTKEDQPDFAVRRQLVLEVLSQHGELLVTSVLVSCVEKVPSRLIAGLSDIVSKLFEIDQLQTSRWLETAVARLPTHKAGGSVTATIAQRHEFIAEVAAATGEGSVREEFEDFAKLFR